MIESLKTKDLYYNYEKNIIASNLDINFIEPLKNSFVK